jgi:hypothetical protein
MGITTRVCGLRSPGTFPSYPLVLGWFTTNNLGHCKRAVAIAAIFTIQGTGSFLGTYTFTDSQAPRCVVGYAICMVIRGVIDLYMGLHCKLVVGESCQTTWETRLPSFSGESRGARGSSFTPLPLKSLTFSRIRYTYTIRW